MSRTHHIQALKAAANAYGFIERRYAIRIMNGRAPRGSAPDWGQRRVYRYLHPQGGNHALMAVLDPQDPGGLIYLTEFAEAQIQADLDRIAAAARRVAA